MFPPEPPVAIPIGPGTARSGQGRAGVWRGEANPSMRRSVAVNENLLSVLLSSPSLSWAERLSCGDGHVKDTPIGVAKRILDRDGAAHILDVQSEGEGPRLHSSIFPVPHCASLPSALFVDLSVLCNFGYFIKRRCDLDGGFLPAWKCRPEPGFARSHLKMRLQVESNPMLLLVDCCATAHKLHR